MEQTEPINQEISDFNIKSFEQLIFSNGIIATFGGQAKALEYIENQQLKNRMHKKRLKDKIKKAFSNPNL
jgi:hypothetical protein